MKKFISGIIVGVLLMGSVSFAASNLTAIKSTFGTTLNGKKVTQNIITINGAYYADLKQLAGNLGIKYAVDTKGKNILLGEAPAANKFSMNNPAPIGTMQTIKFDNLLTSYTANITVKEITRGEAAWELIKEANMFNSEPEAGYEYILAKIDFKLTNAPEDIKYDLGGYDFDLVSDKNKTYDKVSAVEPEPSLDAELYKDASNEGYAVFKVAINDKTPKITFGRKYDGSGGIWFKAYK